MKRIHVFGICLLWLMLVSATPIADAKDIDRGEPGPDAIEVIEAKFGAATQWVDLTAELQAHVKEGRLNLASLEPIFEGVKDPAFGHDKSLVVAYRHRDRVTLKIVRTDGAPTRWGSITLPETDMYRVRLFLGDNKDAALDRKVPVNHPIDLESEASVSLAGELSQDKRDKLHFKGRVTFSSGANDFDVPVEVGERVHPNGGAFSGGILLCYVIFDRADRTGKNQGDQQLDKNTVRKAVARYEAELLNAQKEFEKKSEQAGAALMSSFEELQTAEAGRLQVVAAFYGQNISWLDVTDKVRDAVGKKKHWSTQVNTKDWGEPAPAFGGPRTLIVAYLSKGKVAFKAVYQGHEMSLP